MGLFSRGNRGLSLEGDTDLLTRPELEDDEDMQSGAWRAGGGAGGGDYRSKYQSYSGG